MRGVITPDAGLKTAENPTRPVFPESAPACMVGQVQLPDEVGVEMDAVGVYSKRLPEPPGRSAALVLNRLGTD